MQPAFFLDRDGVINRKLPENNYVSTWEKFTFLPGAIEAIGLLNTLGFLTIIVTNQRGIGRGFMSLQNLLHIHQRMCTVIEKNGHSITDIFFCPHDIPTNCNCRKPKPGMIWQALEKYNIDLTRSFLAGDSPSDILMGTRVGCHCFWVNKNKSLLQIVQSLKI